MKNCNLLKKILLTLLALACFSVAMQAAPFCESYSDNQEWQKTDNFLPRMPLQLGSAKGYYWAIVENGDGGYDLYTLNDGESKKEWVKKNSIVLEKPFIFDKVYVCNDHYAVILGRSGTEPVILTPTLSEEADSAGFDWVMAPLWEMHSPLINFQPSEQQQYNGGVFYFDALYKSGMESADSLYFEVKENPLTWSSSTAIPPKYFSMRASSFSPYEFDEASGVPISSDKTNGTFVLVMQRVDVKFYPDGAPEVITITSRLGLTKAGETYIASGLHEVEPVGNN